VKELIIRKATVDDAETIAELVVIAGDGFSEYLLQGVVPPDLQQKMIQEKVADTDTPLSYQYAVVAEIDGKIVGFWQANTTDILHPPKPEEESIVPFERLDYLFTPMYTHLPRNSLYLQSIAVFSEYRKTGIGIKLLEDLKESAKKQHFNSITLHAWKDNITAISLYQRGGYRVVRQLEIKSQPFLPHEGGMVLMQLDL
jgi:ribosomal protein S18 acetylase RimI-like enzyme